MAAFINRRVRAVGEAMVELAPVGQGLYRRGFAGDTFNTAWAMARWLGPAAEVGMVTRIGTDALSRDFAREMGEDGLDLSGVTRDPGREMGLYLIALEGVERSFHYWRSQSAARHLADDPAALTAALSGVGLIHLSGITLAILARPARARLFTALEAARAGGSVVSFDPNIRPRLWSSAGEIRATLTRMLALTDIALPSFDDESAHFGDAAPTETLARMAEAGVGEIAVKCGAGPVLVLDRGGAARIETPPVQDIRDTTGAGDAFNAGYLAARLTGHAPREAVAHGQRLSALVLQHFGARAPAEAIAALRRPF